MNIFLLILMVLVCLVLLGVSGYFTVKGAVDIKDSSKYSDDDNFQKAHKYLTTASIVCWISIAALLLVGILFVVFLGAFTLGGIGKLFFWIMFLVMLGLLGVIGAYSALAAQQIRMSKNYSSSNSTLKKAFEGSLISSGCSLGALVLIIGMFISMFVSKRKSSSDDDYVDDTSTSPEDYDVSS